MTFKQIEAKQMSENLKFEAAKAIRAKLDELKKAMGKEWSTDVEEDVLEMVTAEE